MDIKISNNDILFKIIDITDNIVTLKGVDLRLYADSEIEDLTKEEVKLNTVKSDREIIIENLKKVDLNRDEYFYLPGKILHIDGDEEYLERCINFYHIITIIII